MIKFILPFIILFSTSVETVKANEPHPEKLVFGDHSFVVYDLPENSLNIGRKQNQVTLHYKTFDDEPLLFMAHNFLSGKWFYELGNDSQVDVVYDDGSIRSFVIVKVIRYQVKGSNWIDLDTGESFNESVVAGEIRFGKHDIALMTCIQKGRNLSWGRAFWIGADRP